VRRGHAIPLIFSLLLLAGCTAMPANRSVPAVSAAEARGDQPGVALSPPPATTPAPSVVASQSPAPSTASVPAPAQQTTKPANPGKTAPASAPVAAAAQPPVQPAQAGPRLAILVYHEVDDQVKSDYTVTPAHFEAQLQMLKAEGYSFYRLADVERLLAGDKGLPEKGVMLAFDDGYQSFATKVLPLARKYNVPAVCFVVTKYASLDIIFGRPHMSAVEIQAAVGSGLLELAGHSWDGHRTAPGADGTQVPVLTQPIKQHPSPTVETQAEYEQRVLEDFRKTAELLTGWGAGNGAKHFTFPYTARSDEAVRLGQQAGFRYFYVGGEQLVTPQSDPTAIPRVHAGAPYITADVLKETLYRLFSN
jgi:peptidoglycan/xylan/chitin deacetylase (PgdA/CDA1 family)